MPLGAVNVKRVGRAPVRPPDYFAAVDDPPSSTIAKGCVLAG